MLLRLGSEDFHKHLPAGCANSVQYLQELRQTWAKPDVPQTWIDPPYEDPDENRDWHWDLNESLARMYLSHVESVLPTISTDLLAERSPFQCRPSFWVSSERHTLPAASDIWDETKVKMWMSSCQVVQFLQYRGEEHHAQCAIANALDGIPGAYVRKRNLTELPPNSESPYEVPHIDCAVVLVPIGPSTEKSLTHLRQVPISLVNPAFVLCAKGPSRWEGDVRPSASLSSIVESLAGTAEITLKALTDTWCLRLETLSRHPDVVPPADDEWHGAEALPACAVPLGIVYDAEAINFVAYVPYKKEGASEYECLPLLFDTLPFPACCEGDVVEFILGRYKVAYAMLCIQQHVLRLASIWERIYWPSPEPEDDIEELPKPSRERSPEVIPPVLPEVSKAVADALNAYKLTRDKLFTLPTSVTPSDHSSDLGLLIDDSATGANTTRMNMNKVRATKQVEDYWMPRLFS